MLLSSPANVDRPLQAERITPAVHKLDAWLQTMRGSGGFAGPISHWWESSWLYCGPMIDWRYEGILTGYVRLFEATGREVWLERAQQAADDVVAAQLPSGCYRNSSFQYGAIEGGTPHEAGINVGLLELARALRRRNDPAWSRYAETAERNLRSYWLGPLWSGQGFKEQPWDNTLVPNKNATATEALLLYEELSGYSMLDYTRPAVQVVLNAQERSGPRAGATVHTGTGRHRLTIGIYTARSMCGVLRFYERYPDPALLEAVGAALIYLNRLVTPDGTYFGHYQDGSLIANPRWIAPSGDLLRVAALASRYGLTPPGLVDRLVNLLVGRQTPSGGLPTAYGFAKRGLSQPHRGLPELRDVLPVVGWCDKAFRALSLLVDPTAGEPQVETAPTTLACTWKGKPHAYRETRDEIAVRDTRSQRLVFRWRKGQTWSDVFAL